MTYSPLRIVALVLGSLALLVIGFIGGQVFDRIHLRHELSWGDNYERNFFGQRERMPLPGMGPMLRAHSVLGKILTIDTNTVTVQDRSSLEQSILLTNKTIFRRDASPATKNDLKIGMQIAVFGQPNSQGQIQADFVRLFTAPLPSSSTTPSTSPTSI